MTAATATKASDEQTIETFVAELREMIKREGLTPIDAPFLRKLRAGELTRPQLRTWAEQFYLGSLNAPKWLANDLINCPDPDLAREFAENIYEEMTGRLSGSKNHAELCRDFLRALDFTDEQIAAIRPIPRFRPVFDLDVPKKYDPEDWWIKVCLDGLLFEGAFGDASQLIYDALVERYGFTPEQARFFDVHAEADKEHGETLMKAFGHIANTEAGREKIRQRVLDAARRAQLIYENYGDPKAIDEDDFY